MCSQAARRAEALVLNFGATQLLEVFSVARMSRMKLRAHVHVVFAGDAAMCTRISTALSFLVTLLAQPTCTHTLHCITMQQLIFWHTES